MTSKSSFLNPRIHTLFDRRVYDTLLKNNPAIATLIKSYEEVTKRTAVVCSERDSLNEEIVLNTKCTKNIETVMKTFDKQFDAAWETARQEVTFVAYRN